MIIPQSISLNGEWDFIADPSAVLSINNLDTVSWRTAIVPLSWQAQFEDLRDYQGVAWYKKTFSIERAEDKIYVLKFNAVEYVSKLYINKQFVGQNEGGYTPFDFDITEYLQNGDNELVLRVMDPLNVEAPTEGISYWHIPHGKQTWYVQNSGIWQDVTLLIKPELYIKKIHITPTMDGKVNIFGSLNQSSNNNAEIRVHLIKPNGQSIINKTIIIEIQNNEFSFTEVIPNPELWSFDFPNLYRIELTIGEDTAQETFGLRSFEAKNKRLYLNGTEFYLIGALDQDFYPETIYTTPSEEYLRDQMLKAKRLGLNMLRCHIKVPDPLYLKIADEVGLLIWYELPNWGQFTDEAAARGSELLTNMIERDWNHPSLVIISIINESWGIDLQKEEQRKWLIEEFDRVKEKAVGRLIIDNSACWGNFHLKTDINDYHTYWAIPENKNKFDKTIDDFASRPDWLFSEFGDSQESGDEPLILSEFGNWGLPKLPEDLPWWFERQFLDIEISLPSGVHNRFKDYKLDKIFGSFNQLSEESQRAQFRSLKYEIEKLRMTPEIKGYVITEFTDINWECNGLLDMWRNFKSYSNELSHIQQQDVIIPRPVKYNYRVGEEARIDLFLSHYSDKDLSNASVEWRSKNSTNKIKIQNPAIFNVTQIDPITFIIPETENSSTMRIDITLKGKDNSVLAQNYTELYIFPLVNRSAAQVILHNPDLGLDGLLKHSEFDSIFTGQTQKEKVPLIICNNIDSTIILKLKKGESVICLVDSTTTLPESFPYKIISREEEWLDGNWATNLNWRREENILFNNISFGKSFGFEAAEAAPMIILGEIPAEKFSDVLSGMYVGWLHKNSAYIFQIRAGDGKLIFCTFPIAANYSKDPFAKELLHNLIDYINSEECNPETYLLLD